MKYTLTVQKRDDNTFTLVDSSGCLCGFYSSEKHALKAKPKIEKNLEFFYEHGQRVYLKKRPKRRKKFNSRKNRR